MASLFIPGFLIAISGIIFYWHFSHGEDKFQWKIWLGAIGIVICLVFLIYEIIIEDGSGFALFGAALAALIALISGLVLAVRFRNKKFFGILFGFVFPVLMFALIWLALDHSPTANMRRSGLELAASLDQYHEDNGYYPASLHELVPDYVTDLRSPDNQWGWLYRNIGDNFAVGYVADVDKFGYVICLISAMKRDWGCVGDTGDYFSLGPTPTP